MNTQTCTLITSTKIKADIAKMKSFAVCFMAFDFKFELKRIAYIDVHSSQIK
jgi:hypothetical protein